MRLFGSYRLPGLFYADRAMVRRWASGRHFPGIHFVYPDGRSRILIPTGRRVTSVYGPRRVTLAEGRDPE